MMFPLLLLNKNYYRIHFGYMRKDVVTILLKNTDLIEKN